MRLLGVSRPLALRLLGFSVVSFPLESPRWGLAEVLGSPLQGRSMINAGALCYCATKLQSGRSVTVADSTCSSPSRAWEHCSESRTPKQAWRLCCSHRLSSVNAILDIKKHSLRTYALSMCDEPHGSSKHNGGAILVCLS